MCRLLDLCSIDTNSIMDNPYFIHGVIGLAFIFAFFIIFMLAATILAAFNKRKEMKAISSSFKTLVKDGDYSFPKTPNPLQTKISTMKVPSVINQIIKSLDETREAYLGDVIFKIRREVLSDENSELTEFKKDTFVEQYTTWLLIPHNFPIRGEIKIKPRREITGLVSDIPDLLGYRFPGILPSFEKSYIVKADNVSLEDMSLVLSKDIQKTLVTRKGTYPVNTDVKWITLTKDALLVECCRIMESEDLRRLVTFGKHIIERPPQKTAKTTRKRTKKAPETEPEEVSYETVEITAQETVELQLSEVPQVKEEIKTEVKINEEVVKIAEVKPESDVEKETPEPVKISETEPKPVVEKKVKKKTEKVETEEAAVKPDAEQKKEEKASKKPDRKKPASSTTKKSSAKSSKTKVTKSKTKETASKEEKPKGRGKKKK
jgi:hypothetical protein